MSTKQLYEKTSEGMKAVSPLVSIEDIYSKLSDTPLEALVSLFNHVKCEWKGSVADTRRTVPLFLRRSGLFITYNNGTKYITEFFSAGIDQINTEDWVKDSNWTPVPDEDYISAGVKPGVGTIGYEQLNDNLKQLFREKVNVTNFPDNEDIVSVDNMLKLKDREADAANFQSKGYVILRKNLRLVNGVVKNILTQDMINNPNTIYEIRYDFDLNGKILNVPDGFKIIGTSGGSISNGALVGYDIEIRNIKAKNINIRTFRTLMADNVNISNEKYFNIGRKGCFILEANNDADVTITNCNISFAENVDDVYGCAVKLIQNGSYNCKLNIKNNVINSWNIALETQGNSAMFNGIIENNIVKNYFGTENRGNGIAISLVGGSDNLLAVNNYSEGGLIALEIAHKCVVIGNVLYSEDNFSVSITNTKDTILDQEIFLLNNTLKSNFRFFNTNNVVLNGNYIKQNNKTLVDSSDNITYMNNVFVSNNKGFSVFAVYGKDNIVMNNYFHTKKLKPQWDKYMTFAIVDYSGKDASTNNIFKNNYIVIDNIKEALESGKFYMIDLQEAKGENSKKTTRVLNNVVRGYNDNDYIDNDSIPSISDSKILNFVYNKTYSLPMWWNGSKWVDSQNNTPNIKSGATENRPTLNSFDKGFEYYDTTLNKKIIWNGITWVNLDGSSLDIKKSGTTEERPSNVEIGFIYKDTTLNKLILWEGTKWVNLNGTELAQ